MRVGGAVDEAGCLPVGPSCGNDAYASHVDPRLPVLDDDAEGAPKLNNAGAADAIDGSDWLLVSLGAPNEKFAADCPNCEPAAVGAANGNGVKGGIVPPLEADPTAVEVGASNPKPPPVVHGKRVAVLGKGVADGAAEPAANVLGVTVAAGDGADAPLLRSGLLPLGLWQFLHSVASESFMASNDMAVQWMHDQLPFEFPQDTQAVAISSFPTEQTSHFHLDCCCCDISHKLIVAVPAAASAPSSISIGTSSSDRSSSLASVSAGVKKATRTGITQGFVATTKFVGALSSVTLSECTLFCALIVATTQSRGERLARIYGSPPLEGPVSA